MNERMKTDVVGFHLEGIKVSKYFSDASYLHNSRERKQPFCFNSNSLGISNQEAVESWKNGERVYLLQPK